MKADGSFGLEDMVNPLPQFFIQPGDYDQPITGISLCYITNYKYAKTICSLTGYLKEGFTIQKYHTFGQN